MSRKLNFSEGIGLRGLRMLAGIPAHAASAHARCVGARLKDQSHPAAPLGSAGMLNVGWQNLFVAASASCGQSVPKVTRTRKTPVSG